MLPIPLLSFRSNPSQLALGAYPTPLPVFLGGWTFAEEPEPEPTTPPSGLPFDLDDAIWGRLAEYAGLTQAFGRAGWLWINDSQPGDPLPHATLIDPASGSSEMTTTGGYTDEAERQINIFARSRTEAKQLGAQVLAVLDPATGWQPIDFQDGRAFSRWQTRPPICELDPDPGPDGADVWTYRIFYTFLVAREQGGL